MSVDSFSAVQNFINESTKALYKVLPPSQKKHLSKNRYDNGALMSRAVSGVTISNFGKQISDMFEELEQIEDPERRRKAQEGMGKVMRRLGDRGDPEELLRFARILDRLMRNDKSAFQKAFLMAEAVSEAGLNLDGWIETFLGIKEEGILKDFLAETEALVLREWEDEELMRGTFNRFMATLNVLSKASAEKQKSGVGVREFLKALSGQAGLHEKNAYLDKVSKKGSA